MLLDAAGPGHGILLPLPELWRKATFRDLHFLFPGARLLLTAAMIVCCGLRPGHAESLTECPSCMAKPETPSGRLACHVRPALPLPLHPPNCLADGIVLGLHNSLSGRCCMNPPPDQRLRRGDQAVMLHPGK